MIDFFLKLKFPTGSRSSVTSRRLLSLHLRVIKTKEQGKTFFTEKNRFVSLERPDFFYVFTARERKNGKLPKGKKIDLMLKIPFF